MLVVVLATVVVAQTIMLPLDAEWVADSALWSLASLSNVYFWLFQDVSYFAADSKELPLLHLWSLGVEEQFYLVWPFLLILFYRASRVRPLVLVLIIAGACSFVLGEAVLGSAPKFAYYMLPARAGELLAGALVAIAVLRQTNHYIPGYLAVLMSWLGVALLVYSFSMLSEEQAFPGLNAIPPALGAASIILAAH